MITRAKRNKNGLVWDGRLPMHWDDERENSSEFGLEKKSRRPLPAEQGVLVQGVELWLVAYYSPTVTSCSSVIGLHVILGRGALEPTCMQLPELSTSCRCCRVSSWPWPEQSSCVEWLEGLRWMQPKFVFFLPFGGSPIHLCWVQRQGRAQGFFFLFQRSVLGRVYFLLVCCWVKGGAFA